MSLGEKQHQVAAGLHTPYVYKYVGETTLGKGLGQKMMSTTAAQVMVEVKKKKIYKLNAHNYSQQAAAE